MVKADKFRQPVSNTRLLWSSYNNGVQPKGLNRDTRRPSRRRPRRARTQIMSMAPDGYARQVAQARGRSGRHHTAGPLGISVLIHWPRYARASDVVLEPARGLVRRGGAAGRTGAAGRQQDNEGACEQRALNVHRRHPDVVGGSAIRTPRPNITLSTAGNYAGFTKRRTVRPIGRTAGRICCARGAGIAKFPTKPLLASHRGSRLEPPAQPRAGPRATDVLRSRCSTSRRCAGRANRRSAARYCRCMDPQGRCCCR